MVCTEDAGMPQYVDGFVLPVPRDRLDEYQRVARAVAAVWKEYGALDYLEFVSDDMILEGTRSFADVVPATEDDVIVFGWVAFESRAARDLANKKVAADPRVAELIEAADTGFDAARMAYGGFLRFV